MKKNERVRLGVREAHALSEKLAASMESVELCSADERRRFREREERARLIDERVRVELGLRHFVSSGETWPSRELFVDALLSHWYMLLEQECALYERPSDESQCNDACLGTYYTIVTLCADVNLYGCTRHGSVHYCDRRSCRARIKTTTWHYACMFSGAEVGRGFAAVASLSAEYRSGSRRAGFKSVAVRRQAATVGSFEYAGASRDIAAQIERGEEITLGVAPTEAATAPSGGGGGGGGGGPALRRPTNAERRSFRFGRRVGQLQRDAERALNATAGRVVDDVLFCVETRQLLNVQIMDETERAAHRAVLDYHVRTRMAHGVPNRITSACAYATPFRRMVQLPLLGADLARRSRLVRLCFRLWKLCHRTPYAAASRRPDAQEARPRRKRSARQSSCTFVQFCLAVMFVQRTGFSLMRQGETCFVLAARRHIFVPLEPRMMFDLPAEDNIDAFGARSTERLRDNIGTGSTSVGLGRKLSPTDDQHKRKSISDDLIKADGSLTQRKRRHKRRQAASSSGAKQITMRGSAMGEKIATTESEVLPAHLHSSLLGEAGAYEKSDIARGRNFLRSCLNSLPADAIESESRALFE